MPQPEKTAPPGPPPAGGARRAATEEPPQEQLLAALAMLAELLSRGIVITSERLQETVDEAIRRGRMTRQDAEELAGNLVEIGRRQALDALEEVEGLIGRSADRLRRAAGIAQAFPIIGYGELTAAQVRDRLVDLDDGELRTVRDHERRNANRTSVLTAIDRYLE